MRRGGGMLMLRMGRRRRRSEIEGDRVRDGYACIVALALDGRGIYIIHSLIE